VIERLLALLESRANHRGRVIVREPVLLSALDTSHEVLAQLISVLERDRVIEILAPLPFLVIKLLKWSRAKSVRSSAAHDSTAEPSRALRGPVSKQAAAASSKQEDGGAGEGEALLADLLTALGETDATEFRAIVTSYPAAVIRQALRRVALTPPSQIRKSKAALFRFLLGKLA
jgi:hypothetical protein